MQATQTQRLPEEATQRNTCKQNYSKTYSHLPSLHYSYT